MDSNASTELELIIKSRNSEFEVLEQSPPGYPFEWETVTRAQLIDPEFTTFAALEKWIALMIETNCTKVYCSVYKASDNVSPITNVSEYEGKVRAYKVRVGELIIMYGWNFVGSDT